MNLSKRRKKLSAEKKFTHTCVDGSRLSCILRRKKGVKNIYLRIKCPSFVEVSAPLRVDIDEAKRMVGEKEGWILKSLDRFERFCRCNPQIYFDGCKIWYLGERYEVRYERAKASRLIFEDGRFYYKALKSERFEKSVDSFYKRMAEKLLFERVEVWSQKMGLYPKEIKLRRYKSRWGCCTHDNVITLNISLMRYDLKLIDYVIVHELAHIRFKHHKKEFWELVASFVPNYKELRRSLV